MRASRRNGSGKKKIKWPPNHKLFKNATYITNFVLLTVLFHPPTLSNLSKFTLKISCITLLTSIDPSAVVKIRIKEEEAVKSNYCVFIK